MWIKVAQFIWNHFWKMVSALLVIGFWAFVDSVQQPEKVQATILKNAEEIAELRKENILIKSSVVANNILFTSIDSKLDKLIINQSVLSQEVQRLQR